MVCDTFPANSFKHSAKAASSGVASLVAAFCLAFAEILPSGSRARIAPFVELRILPPCSMSGFTVEINLSWSSEVISDFGRERNASIS